MKEINGFKDYFIDDNGNVFSNKSGRMVKKNPFKGSSEYPLIDLYKDGKSYKRLVHRLVAEHFVPNPDEKPIVDHKDNDRLNVQSSNLQWVTQKENVHKSYLQTGMDATRNFVECNLFKDGELVGEFRSVTDAAKFASSQYGISQTMIDKHRKYKDFEIVSKV